MTGLYLLIGFALPVILILLSLIWMWLSHQLLLLGR